MNDQALALNEPRLRIQGAETRGIALHTFDDLWRFAGAVAQSGLAPKGMEKQQACFVAIQMGAELGMPPMASLQNIAVINGRPSIWGDAQLGVCRGSGLFDEDAFAEGWQGDGKTLGAFCEVRRLPNGKVCRREFSVADATLAGLWGKAGPWTQYPKRMLQCRARSWALRDTFSDVLRGFHSVEEAQDIPRDITDEPTTVIRMPEETKPQALARGLRERKRAEKREAPPASDVPEPEEPVQGDAEQPPKPGLGSPPAGPSDSIIDGADDLLLLVQSVRATLEAAPLERQKAVAKAEGYSGPTALIRALGGLPGEDLQRIRDSAIAPVEAETDPADPKRAEFIAAIIALAAKRHKLEPMATNKLAKRYGLTAWDAEHVGKLGQNELLDLHSELSQKP